MTVGELKELLKWIDDNTQVCITTDDNLFINASVCSSGIDEIQFEDETEFVFVISPCEEVINDILIEDAENALYQINEN